MRFIEDSSAMKYVCDVNTNDVNVNINVEVRENQLRLRVLCLENANRVLRFETKTVKMLCRLSKDFQIPILVLVNDSLLEGEITFYSQRANGSEASGKCTTEVKLLYKDKVGDADVQRIRRNWSDRKPKRSLFRERLSKYESVEEPGCPERNPTPPQM